MASVRIDLEPESAAFLATAFPQFDKFNGTNFPVTGLRYDTTTAESAFWKIDPFSYGSGDLTLDIIWQAESATTGVVVWDAQLAAITPDADSQDVTTDGLTTANTVSDTHLGTTAKRLHQATMTINNLDSLAVGDIIFVKITRDTGDAADTMAGDVWLLQARLTYSTT